MIPWSGARFISFAALALLNSIIPASAVDASSDLKTASDKAMAEFQAGK